MRTNRYEELVELVKSLEKDFDRFYTKDNHAAGTRIRHGMQELKSLAQDIRVSVQDEKKKEVKADKKVVEAEKK